MLERNSFSFLYTHTSSSLSSPSRSSISSSQLSPPLTGLLGDTAVLTLDPLAPRRQSSEDEMLLREASSTFGQTFFTSLSSDADASGDEGGEKRPRSSSAKLEAWRLVSEKLEALDEGTWNGF